MGTKIQNSVGRPSKFTDKTKERIYELLDTPISLTAVCRGVHISTTTLRDWRKTGYRLEDGITNGNITEEDLTELELEFLSFSRKCDEIEMELEKRLVEDVYGTEKSGKRFILGKRFGAYRDKTEVDVSGTVDVNHSWKDLVTGDLEKE